MDHVRPDRVSSENCIQDAERMRKFGKRASLGCAFDEWLSWLACGRSRIGR